MSGDSAAPATRNLPVIILTCVGMLLSALPGLFLPAGDRVRRLLAWAGLAVIIGGLVVLVVKSRRTAQRPEEAAPHRPIT